MTTTKKAADSASGSRRKPYATPRLVSYGHVKDIVQGSTGSMGGDGGATTKPCWVAEALYGADDVRTVLLRGWLSEVYVQKRRWWFLVAAYVKFGPSIANLIYSKRLPRRPLLPLFTFLTERAFDESAGRIKAAERRA